MSQSTVNFISAFGRGETLALALHEHGFQVRIFDFTNAFPMEYHRGAGPFPVIDKAFTPAQREFLNEVELQPQGLTLWLKEGPIELTGPFSGVHIHSHPEIQAWKTNSSAGDFSRQWLKRFLREWTCAYYSDSWSEHASYEPFPAELLMGCVPYAREASLFSFDRLKVKGVEVVKCTSLQDVQFQSGRISEVELIAGTTVAIRAQQWVWCLSSSETKMFGEDVAHKIFGRHLLAPEWAWIGFKGGIHKGPWIEGLPGSFVVLGDVYLPWCYGNLAVVQRTDELKTRVWLKVPRARMHEIDARRQWSSDAEKILWQRLPMAEWKIDSADWSVCPHSEIYPVSKLGTKFNQWRNWHLISPETSSRLDMGARLENESECFRKLLQFRNEQVKKGGRSDHAVHAT